MGYFDTTESERKYKLESSKLDHITGRIIAAMILFFAVFISIMVYSYKIKCLESSSSGQTQSPSVYQQESKPAFQNQDNYMK